MRLIFSGGGTLGSVMPLIAVYQELKRHHPDWQFLWVGTKGGAEKEVAQKYDLEYKVLPAAKWRRYWSFQNLFEPFIFILSFVQSWKLIKEWQPDLLISAGGFVSAPLHLAARFLKKTTLIHQQDIKVGLANRLMSRLADFITVSFESQLKEFASRKTLWLGNPVRAGLLAGRPEAAISHFNLDPNLFTVLVLGGGTGALSLNRLVVKSLVEFIGQCQVIHMTGFGKEVALPLFKAHPDDKFLLERYHPVQFLDEDLLAQVLAAADLVITRAGLSTLSELAVLGKPVLIVPLPDSHQLANAEYFASRSSAPIFGGEKSKPAEFVREVKRLLEDNHERLMVGHNLKKLVLPEAREKMRVLIEEIAKTKNPA